MVRKRRRADEAEDEARINISPLIDCIFILLIFFIVSTSFIDESGFTVERGGPGGGGSVDEDGAKFRIDDRGKIYFNQARIPLSHVRAKVKNALRRNEEAPVIIEVGLRTRTGIALKVQDEARMAGARKITLARHRPK